VTKKLILPAGHFSEKQRTMLGMLAAAGAAVQRNDVLDLVVAARVKAAENMPAGAEPTITSGHVEEVDNFYLMVLAMFDKVPICCDNRLCPKKIARDAARVELTRLAKCNDGVQLQHNVVTLQKPTLVNGGIS
jgi:hypothetical protein